MVQIHPSIKNPWEHVMATTKRQSLWEHAYKLIVIALGQAIKSKVLRLFGHEYRVSDAVLAKIKETLQDGYYNYGYRDPEVFEAFWADFLPLLEHNRALCEFMFIGDAAHSRTYVNWVLTIMRDGDYSRGMMVAVGEGLDYAGKPQKILEDDSFARGVAWGWTMGEAIHRQMVARTIMLSCHHVAILGAGLLPELSTVYGPLPSGLTIDACDINDRINITELMLDHPGLYYTRSGALDFLQQARPETYDAIFMPGVMSYNMDDFDTIFESALAALKPGGTFLFDMQILHPELICVKIMYHWADDVPSHGMKLMTGKKTIATVEAACERFGAIFDYSSSGHYKSTSALCFTATKKS